MKTKWNSRKLIAAVAGVVGIPAADLPNEAWWVVLIYIVAQAVVDVVKELKADDAE